MQSDNHSDDFIAIVHALSTGRFSGRVGLWLSLVICDGFLSEKYLTSYSQGNYAAFRLRDHRIVLEVETYGGSLERRILSEITAFYISKNDGLFFKRADLLKVDQEVSKIFGTSKPLIHKRILQLAQTYWASRLPGVLWSHSVGLSCFQLLDRHSWWRRDTELHALHSVNQSLPLERSIGGLGTKDITSASSIANELPKIAKRHGSRAFGRQKMLEAIDIALPVAQEEGCAQALALVVLKEVISNGGVSGRVLAPSSISVYVGSTFVRWVQSLIDLGMEAESDLYVTYYDEIIEQHSNSQRGKAKALINALHERLVLRGAPLLGALHWSENQTIASSQIVWPHELELAIEYIEKTEGSPRVRIQARLIVLLGKLIPLRTREYFQIRLVDVFPQGAPTVVIYPRLRDGSHKSPHNRLHQDVSDSRLSDALVELKKVRVEEECLEFEDALPDLLLFGHPNDQSSPYCMQETIELVSAALRWATGNSFMSVYSLRHTAISLRSRVCLESTHVDSDTAVWEQNSRSCGHGNVESTAFYVHDIETVFRDRLNRHLPQHELIAVSASGIQIAPLSTLFRAQQRREIDVVEQNKKKTLTEISFSEFRELLKEIACGTPTKLIEGKLELDPASIPTLLELSKVRWGGLNGARLVTYQDVYSALGMWSVRARHLKQSKYSKIVKYIDELNDDQNLTASLAFSISLKNCLTNGEVALDRGYYSAQLLRHLSSAGYSPKVLIASADKDLSLPADIATRVKKISQEARNGRPSIRLFLVDSGVENVQLARGATLNSTGLHWLSQVIDLWLAHKGVA